MNLFPISPYNISGIQSLIMNPLPVSSNSVSTIHHLIMDSISLRVSGIFLFRNGISCSTVLCVRSSIYAIRNVSFPMIFGDEYVYQHLFIYDIQYENLDNGMQIYIYYIYILSDTASDMASQSLV